MDISYRAFFPPLHRLNNCFNQMLILCMRYVSPQLMIREIMLFYVRQKKIITTRMAMYTFIEKIFGECANLLLMILAEGRKERKES